MINRFLLFRRLSWQCIQIIRAFPYQTISPAKFASVTFTGLALATPAVLYCKEKLKMSDVIEKAQEFYDANKFKELYEYLLEFKDGDDAEVLWRFVRATRDRSTMNDVDKNQKQDMILVAFDVAEKALSLDENSAQCHKWYGIMLSERGDLLGTKKKIEDSPAMKKHFEKACELNPTDATSRYLVGMWCFSFADLAWYERKIAAVVFGSPPESTYAEALEHFEKAESLSPSFYSNNQFMIGLVYLRMKNYAKAKEWFQKVLEYEVIKDEDAAVVKKAQEHLKKC